MEHSECFKTVNIGSVKISSVVSLSPLAGVTDFVMRN